jgi:hypothetical protein
MAVGSYPGSRKPKSGRCSLIARKTNCVTACPIPPTAKRTTAARPILPNSLSRGSSRPRATAVPPMKLRRKSGPMVGTAE